jgi:hypothetical protein
MTDNLSSPEKHLRVFEDRSEYYSASGDVYVFKEGPMSNDAGLIDADAADCIIQVGLLGELVFG